MVYGLFRNLLHGAAAVVPCLPAVAMYQSQIDQAPRRSELAITGAGIRSPAAAAEAAPGIRERYVSVEVENPGDAPLHVWTSRRAYDYDASTHTLTLYLTEHTPDLRPGVEMISDHPRPPMLVVVDANSHGTLNVPVPAMIRRRAPGAGLGMSLVEEPIRQVERVDLHIQNGPEPFQHIAQEGPDEYRKRLLPYGDGVEATITLTGQKER
jgi:hypothetical protein